MSLYYPSNDYLDVSFVLSANYLMAPNFIQQRDVSWKTVNLSRQWVATGHQSFLQATCDGGGWPWVKGALTLISWSLPADPAKLS